jgi:gluconate 5-dehydrogenase
MPSSSRSRIALAKAGVAAETATFDISDPALVEAAVPGIEGRLGPIGILVNNAGISRRGSAVEMPDEAWRAVMSTNLDAVFFVARAVSRRIAERGTGKAINVGLALGQVACPNAAPYVDSCSGPPNSRIRSAGAHQRGVGGV